MTPSPTLPKRHFGACATSSPSKGRMRVNLTVLAVGDWEGPSLWFNSWTWTSCLRERCGSTWLWCVIGCCLTRPHLEFIFSFWDGSLISSRVRNSLWFDVCSIRRSIFIKVKLKRQYLRRYFDSTFPDRVDHEIILEWKCCYMGCDMKFGLWTTFTSFYTSIKVDSRFQTKFNSRSTIPPWKCRDQLWTK